ncbi:MAG: hypothetical protein KKF44_06590 [Nanoarchaeota archaeon]|nr:hypothetical protein [Nanoarchaeota archaeon]
MNTTKIIKDVTLEEYREILIKYKDKININPHALDHLSDGQRKIFKEIDLISIVEKETPRGIGLQKNGRIAAYFRRKEGFMKIILEEKTQRLEIITFMNTDNIPNLKRI